MRKTLPALPTLLLVAFLGACTLSPTSTPTQAPTPITIPSPTLLVVSPTPTVEVAAPTAAPTLSLPTPTTAAAGGGNIIPGNPSGPYAIILVSPTDTLNIRSAAGASNTVVGSFAATVTNVMRTGPSAVADGNLWVEVQKPGGGSGWANAHYLTEYVPPATFCADVRVNNLLTSLGGALTSNNGMQLSGLVSPIHGMTVYLWRHGNPVTFKQSDARWVFDSTYEHNWGAAPASGLDTVGAFHVAVLPKLQEVFNANYSLTCDSLGTATQYGEAPWPLEYTNVNFYTIYKPGTPGVDLDWRYWLVGVEYVQGQPYVFALIHFNWEP